jgi:hypothetical protein
MNLNAFLIMVLPTKNCTTLNPDHFDTSFTPVMDMANTNKFKKSVLTSAA